MLKQLTGATSLPTMRFVAVKSEAQQAAWMAYRTRDLLVRQRTQTIDALRARGRARHYRAGWSCPCRAPRCNRGRGRRHPTAAVRDLARLLLRPIAGSREKVEGPDEDLRRRHYAVVDDHTKRGSDHRSGDPRRLRRRWRHF